MFETLLGITIFGSFVWWAIITSLLLIFFISSEVNENGFIATGSLLVYFGVIYFWGNSDLSLLLTWSTLYNVLLYLGIGIIYFFIRTIVLGNEAKMEVKEYAKNVGHNLKTDVNRDKKDIINYRKRIKKEHISELKGNVSRWIFLWVISLIVWIFTSKIFVQIWNFIWSKISNLVESIFEIGFGKD